MKTCITLIVIFLSVNHAYAQASLDTVKRHYIIDNTTKQKFLPRREEMQIFADNQQIISKELCDCQEQKHRIFMKDMNFLQSPQGIAAMKNSANATNFLLDFNDKKPYGPNNNPVGPPALYGPRQRALYKCQDLVKIKYFGTINVNYSNIDTIPIVKATEASNMNAEKSYTLNYVIPYLKQQVVMGKLLKK